MISRRIMMRVLKKHKEIEEAFMATRENTKQPNSSSSTRESSSSRDSFKTDRNADSSSSRSTGSNTNVKKGTQNLNSSRKSGSSMMDDDEIEE
jgi:hypothetical protein